MLILCFLIFPMITAGTSDVWDLPGSPPSVINMHSGYFAVSKYDNFHYILAESMFMPENDPIIIWANGASGCSDLRYFFRMFGPYTVDPSGEHLLINEFSWTKISNILVIDVPSGAGFSYTSRPVGFITDNDEKANLTVNAIINFFSKFKKFRNNNWYLAGHAADVMFLPFLINSLPETFKNKFKGLILANPYFNHTTEFITRIQYAYHHNLIGYETYHELVSRCCGGIIEKCPVHNLTHANSLFCYEALTNATWNSKINPFNIYEKCEKDLAETSQDTIGDLEYIDDTEFCTNEWPLTKYLSFSEVRRALYIPKEVPNWKACRVIPHDAYRNNTADLFKKLKKNGLRTLIYSGDADLASNFLMSQQFVSQLEFKRIREVTPFFVNKTIAGFHTKYDSVEFATILGGSHAGLNKPEQVLHLIGSFLSFKNP